MEPLKKCDCFFRMRDFPQMLLELSNSPPNSLQPAGVRKGSFRLLDVGLDVSHSGITAIG